MNKNPIEDSNGNKYWFLGGNLHREDGPAIEFVNGDKYWYLNGELHREDGPAIEWAYGDREWWINSIEYSFSEWISFTNKSKEEKCELVLTYG